jgi:hypothetical protein
VNLGTFVRLHSPSGRHGRTLMLITQGESGVEVNLLNDLDHAREKPIHLDHYNNSASLHTLPAILRLTLMCKPFSQLNILGLCSQSEEVALDRTFGISLVQELLRCLFRHISTLFTKRRGHGGRVGQRWKGRCLLGDGRAGLAIIVLSLQVLVGLCVASSKSLAAR